MQADTPPRSALQDVSAQLVHDRGTPCPSKPFHSKYCSKGTSVLEDVKPWSLPHKSETTASLVWLIECSYHFIAARCRCAGRCCACNTPDGKSALLWPGGKASAC